MAESFFVSAIHTGSGKTIVSALLCHCLGADYFKPVQAGDLAETDSDTIRLLSPSSRVHHEAYRLKKAISPHAAFAAENIEPVLPPKLPVTSNTLIVEGAGGLLSPLGENYSNADLALDLNIPIILVVNFYLGSINHTMLSLRYLVSAGLPLAGIVYNGDMVESSRQVIDLFLQRESIPVVANIPRVEPLTAESLQKLSASIQITELDLLHRG